MSFGGYHGWRPYVPVARRKDQAARKIAALRKRGRAVDPVIIEARKIAHTFWGNAWCENLESYSDYANRLPRGRTYVRNGSVIDLQIGPGQVTALVSGSSIYQVDIAMRRAPRTQWRALAKRCAGKIDSTVELLQGGFSRGVMEILASGKTGLFPAPREIRCGAPAPTERPCASTLRPYSTGWELAWIRRRRCCSCCVTSTPRISSPR